jgi:hypothetical protein
MLFHCWNAFCKKKNSMGETNRTYETDGRRENVHLRPSYSPTWGSAFATSHACPLLGSSLCVEAKYVSPPKCVPPPPRELVQVPPPLHQLIGHDHMQGVMSLVGIALGHRLLPHCRSTVRRGHCCRQLCRNRLTKKQEWWAGEGEGNER